MARYLALALSMMMVVALVAPVMAQSQMSPPPPPRDTGPMGGPAKPLAVEGTVSKVDPGTGTIAVSSGWFGLFGRTLQVTPETQIQIEGRQGTLQDLHKGSKVKASYEPRDGKNVATRIEAGPEAQPAATK